MIRISSKFSNIIFNIWLDPGYKSDLKSVERKEKDVNRLVLFLLLKKKHVLQQGIFRWDMMNIFENQSHYDIFQRNSVFIYFKLRGDVKYVSYEHCKSFENTCIFESARCLDISWFNFNNLIIWIFFCASLPNATKQLIEKKDHRWIQMDCFQQFQEKKMLYKTKWSTVNYSKRWYASKDDDAVYLMELEGHSVLRVLSIKSDFTSWPVLFSIRPIKKVAMKSIRS